MPLDRERMTDGQVAMWAQGMSKQFGGRRILRQIDLEVAAGQCVGLAGGNGQGKTTLLGCLAGLIRPTSGQVRWFGHVAGGRPPLRRLIGTVAHEARLYPHLTLEENLVFAGRMCGVGQPAGRARQLLDLVGLVRHGDRLATHASRGMRQRVAIARALVHDPPILLLDEPFSGLDRQGTQWLVEMFDRLRERGRTICFASHDHQTMRQLADRCLQLESGQLRPYEPEGDSAGTGPAWRAHAA